MASGARTFQTAENKLLERCRNHLGLSQMGALTQCRVDEPNSPFSTTRFAIVSKIKAHDSAGQIVPVLSIYFRGDKDLSYVRCFDLGTLQGLIGDAVVTKQLCWTMIDPNIIVDTLFSKLTVATSEATWTSLHRLGNRFVELAELFSVLDLLVASLSKQPQVNLPRLRYLGGVIVTSSETPVAELPASVPVLGAYGSTYINIAGEELLAEYKFGSLSVCIWLDRTAAADKRFRLSDDDGETIDHFSWEPSRSETAGVLQLRGISLE
jgi:hypothetical protein